MTTKTMISKPNDSYQKVSDFLGQFDSNKEVFITASDDKAEIRTKAQNALIHIYYRAISDKEGYELDDAEARCKRKFGLPIMQTQKDEPTKKGKKVFRELLRFGLINNPNEVEKKHILVNYHYLIEEGQVECFKSMEVTRNFNTKQMKRYIESMERFWAQHGLVLESINEAKRYEALLN